MKSLDGRMGTYTIDTKALLEGRGVRKFSEAEFTAATTNKLVLTGLAFNIPKDAILIINEMNGYVESTSSNCAFWLIRCKGENGSGAYEVISDHLHVYTGGAAIPISGEYHAFNPPIVVKYSEAGAAPRCWCRPARYPPSCPAAGPASGSRNNSSIVCPEEAQDEIFSLSIDRSGAAGRGGAGLRRR